MDWLRDAHVDAVQGDGEARSKTYFGVRRMRTGAGDDAMRKVSSSLMSAIPFDCQIYVPRRGNMMFTFPAESGPQRVARLEPLRYDELIDPAFRRLLAAFESVQRPAAVRA